MMLGMLVAAQLASSPALGLQEGRCRTPEPGPAILVDIVGLKDRTGRLRLELYPANDADFLADDNILLAAGKTFARVDVATPASGAVQLCMRAPGPGRFSLSMLHDRDGNHRFEPMNDGIGFAGNPRLGWGKPRAADAAVQVSGAATRITVIANYRHGLRMRPEAQR